MKESRKTVRFAEIENASTERTASTICSQTRPMSVPLPTGSSYAATKSHMEDIICDYDSSVTQLYQLIESSDWDGTAERCRTHPEEVRTWVVRRQKDPNKIRWKLLPLHTAVVFQSPEDIVFALLQEYPEAIKATDDQGATPLHLAFRHYQHDEALLKLLLEAHPHAIIAKDYRGRTPLDLAMKRNGKYSAKLMHLYSSICMEITLQAVDESWRKEVGNIEEIECPIDEGVVDQLAYEDCQRDEIALLANMEECEHAVREQPKVGEDSRESDIEEYGIDEMAQLEQAEQDGNEATVRNKTDDHESDQQPVSESISVGKDNKPSDDEMPDKTTLTGEIEIEAQLRKKEEEKDDELDEFWSAEDEEVETTEGEEQSLNVSDADAPKKEDLTTTMLQEKHHKEVVAIRQHYEDRIQAMAHATMTILQKVHHDTKSAIRDMKEQYSRDLERIKNHLTEEEKKGTDTTIHLRDEIIRLQLRLGEQEQSKSERDLQALQSDQLLLQRLIRDQQKELDTAQAIRALMLKSLWQQDEEEGAARKIDAEAITTLADRMRSRMEILSPDSPFDETRDAIETTELRSNQDDDDGDDDISTITDHSPRHEYD